MIKEKVSQLWKKVCIGANVVIVEKITIGDYVLITLNAYVNFDVPSHSVVVGNLVEIMYRENATVDYV
ncbi:MAG: hypothetical protein R3Y35_10265 [Clostridia bacterium]